MSTGPVSAEPKIIAPIIGKHTGKAPAIRALKRRYPDLSNPEIARQVGCDVSNVASVLQRYLGKCTEEELRKYQASKADIYDSLQMRALTSITDEKLQNSNVTQLAIAAGIWEDKARVIRGQATSINATVLWDAVEVIRELRQD